MASQFDSYPPLLLMNDTEMDMDHYLYFDGSKFSLIESTLISSVYLQSTKWQKKIFGEFPETKTASAILQLSKKSIRYRDISAFIHFSI